MKIIVDVESTCSNLAKNETLRIILVDNCLKVSTNNKHRANFSGLT